MKPNKQTNIISTTNRASLILGIILLIFIISGSLFVLIGAFTGSLNKKIVSPVSKNLNSYFSGILDIIEIQDQAVTGYPNPDFDTNSSQSADVEILETATPTPKVIYNKTIYVYPTYSPTKYTYPTIAPGEPGSKEFDQKFQQMQQDYQNSFNQMCKDHPDIPPCKK